MTPPKSLLIDVRSPAEFATGSLSLDLRPAINIEYQLIDTLPAVYPDVSKDTSITLYCRSGRRSDIALKTLKALGYTNARDIGGLEDARAVLDKETVTRQLEEGMEQESDEKEIGKTGKENVKSGERVEAFGKLMEGLRALDD
ncbi:hypothetical protein P153DRAFT_387814 [Dothidotthia symphoricarpi CBS 119687]|uniref:Rhodanese domain-containing protein n=1 Tax=Dothidotthia symphoricarpi CBS 119687 TaxID=1392245 RepID=A0A6A6A8W6_9PLEO|nr:uncharacterized protein P153DRAFT_387814 [Dothidotthia symphoricarpi CBS 119687]KAF2127267.1 hypothetical protein P153DRAFT_387814 [Dothidotthia symphoricarpi CBS 119687]